MLVNIFLPSLMTTPDPVQGDGVTDGYHSLHLPGLLPGELKLSDMMLAFVVSIFSLCVC